MSVSLGANGANYNYPETGDLSWGANATNFASAVSAALAKLGLGSTLSTDAVIDITSTSKGIRIPSMTTTQRNAIVTPATGLLIFNTTSNRINFYYSGWKEIIINGETSNVGIGTDSPAYKLDVNGDIRSNSIIIVNDVGSIRSVPGILQLQAGTSGIEIVNNANNSVFVKITSIGYVGIGTSSPAVKLDVNGDIKTNSVIRVNDVGFIRSVPGILQVQGGTSGLEILNNDGNAFFVKITSTGYVGIGTTPSYQLHLSADSAGKPSTNVWTITSDERIKDNIVLADLDRCYEIVKNLPLKKYAWKYYDTTQAPDQNMLGWIAQDVQTYFPKSVNVSKFVTKKEVKENDVIIEQEESIDDCLNLNADQINKVLYGAVQKLQAIVETQQAKILELENRINTLEGN